MPMMARCELTMTRSVLNRPSALIWSSSSAICGCTLANMSGVPPDRYLAVLAVRPGEYYLAAAAGAHRVEGGLEVRGIEPVCDDRADVDTRLCQHRHLVPGLEHLPAVDALDRDHVEHQVRP